MQGKKELFVRADAFLTLLFYPVKSSFQYLAQSIGIYSCFYLLAQILLVTNKKNLVHIRQLIGLELYCIRDIGVEHAEC